MIKPNMYKSYRLFANRNNKDPDNLLSTNKSQYIWICATCNSEWYATVSERLNGDKPCPGCSGERAIPGKTSFQALYPDMAKEYSDENVFDCDDILPTYSITVVWECLLCDMKWFGSVRDRTNGSKECPYCSGKKAIPGKTSFKALHSDLIKEYSSTNNYNPDLVLPTFSLAMKWNCSKCEMEWEGSIKDRVNGEIECPYCSGRKAIPGKTSFKALYPELMNEWKYISNILLINPDYVLPSATKEVWWECSKCQRAYSITIRDKVRIHKKNKKSCPFCKGYRRTKRRYI